MEQQVGGHSLSVRASTSRLPASTMVYNFKVFKKCAPNGKITLYMAKRDFVDHISTVEPIDGVVLLDEDYVRGRKVFGQLVCTFRYGREEDEVMGLNFYKELFLASEQIYPPPEKRNYELSRTQERLIKKLGEGAVPFRLTVPAGAPGSVTLQPGLEDEGEPCGVQYYVKVFVGDSEIDRSHRRSTVALGIRKVQYAPAKPGPQPCTVVRKDFVLSPGQLELELTLDKQVPMVYACVCVLIKLPECSAWYYLLVSDGKLRPHIWETVVKVDDWFVAAAVHPRRDGGDQHVRAQPQQQGGEEDQGVHPTGRRCGALPERTVPQHRGQHRDAVSASL
ncbi:hypothetical protein HF086_001618 [Spodoptera exigua]|uniref:Arrestin-like N-terminal domain-containing protein n=1 Tax=Spodoptera exigua TaxID=7107 RepID=A0A922M4L5_SPOEX|nr:hypothetical protein HF086_001618 [Spodoptera exigua]